MRIVRVLPLVLLAVLIGSCTRDTASPPPSTEPAPASASGGVDPLVPYSPQATPFAERTSGFIPDTLTLPTSHSGKLYVTPVTTTMTTAYVDDSRSLAVYLDVENPTDAAWSGSIGAHAEVTDLNEATFDAVAPVAGDLHPDAARYGGTNRSLLQKITVEPGKTTSGALVFHVTGGNRPITLRISLDGGRTWGEWATNLGVF